MSKLTEKIGPEWVPCVKLPVIVHVREQRPGEKHVSTREGLTPVKPDDLIMRGVAGEEYPIGRELWKMTYTTDTAPQPAATEPLLQRIAELEQRNSDLLEDVQRFKKHALNEKAARLELERQLEEARKDAERLDYIQKNARSDPKMDGNHVWWPTTFNQAQNLKGPTIRAAIDAAVQKGQA